MSGRATSCSGSVWLPWGFLLPFYLWLGGQLLWDVPPQQSISAYYHAREGELRDEFVGALIAIAAFLVCYRGYSKWEDWVLDVAGAFLVGVAVVPMAWPPGTPHTPLTRLHGGLAILFFVLVGYVAGCRSWDTLTEMEEGWGRTLFQHLYRVLAVLMFLIPGLVLLSNVREGPEPLWGNTVFWLEASGIWAFGAFWLAKTLELWITSYERKLFAGGLKRTTLGGCAFCPPFFRWCKERQIP